MRSRKTLCLFIFASLCTISSYAQSVKVAVAANLQSVINVLGDDFKKQSGITVEPIVGSSGKLVAQIGNGAPYDVFLSADMEFPQKLAKDGFTTQGPLVYALGSLIICDSQGLDLKNWISQIITDKVVKVAIANAKIAPYGRAAEEALTKLNLMEKVKAKLVYGESISQVNTYITTQSVTVGFTTQSLVYDQTANKAFRWIIVDRKLYSPIEQGMVLLKPKQGTDAKPAQQFYTYMLSTPAKNILKKYGYIIP